MTVIVGVPASADVPPHGPAFCGSPSRFSISHDAGKSRTFTTPQGRTMTAGPMQPWTWEIMEFFKVEDGLLHEIEAILERAPYGMTSGWSSWEDGMSDKIQFER